MTILAIARDAVRELIRTKQAVPVALLALVVATLFCRFGYGFGDLELRSMVHWFFVTAVTVIFSSGIIGNEISSGRMQLLVTRPIWLSDILYGKICGVLLMMVPVALAANALLLLFSPVPEKNLFPLWLGLTCAMMLSQVLVTTVATALSVFLPGNGNGIALVMCAAAFLMVKLSAESHPSPSAFSILADLVFPHPIALRVIPIQLHASEPVSWSYLFHAIAYTCGGLAIASIGLEHREFPAH
jgi:ABC-type transport system involved in multi-copper enzyme maturation permease subunit